MAGFGNYAARVEAKRREQVAGLRGRPVHVAPDQTFRLRLTVFTAVVALLSSALGATIGIVGGLATTRSQAEFQSEQAQAEFLRVERRASYGSILAKDGGVRRSQDDLLNTIFEYESNVVDDFGEGADFEQAKAELAQSAFTALQDHEQLISDFEASLSSNEMLGTKTSQSAANHMLAYYDVFLSNASQFFHLVQTRHPNSPKNASEREKLADLLFSGQGQSRQAYFAFVRVVRAEFQTEDGQTPTPSGDS